MKLKVKKAVIAAVCLAMMTSLAACGSKENKDAGGEGKKEDAVIRVGSKDFTEGMIVSEVYSLALEDAGYEVERIFDIAGSIIHTSLINDEIDMYPEYTGTALLSILGMDVITDPQEVYDTVKAEYESSFRLPGLTTLRQMTDRGWQSALRLQKNWGLRQYPICRSMPVSCVLRHRENLTNARTEFRRWKKPMARWTGNLPKYMTMV